MNLSCFLGIYLQKKKTSVHILKLKRNKKVLDEILREWK